MARSNRSARNAGTRFESLVARYLANRLDDDRIERRAHYGRDDRGDVAGVRYMGERVVIECKDRSRTELAGWLAEAEAERLHDGASYGLVVHKRKGTQAPADQYVTMTLGTLADMLAAGLDQEEE